MLKLYYMLQREILLAFRKPSILLNPVIFNLINISLFPFAFGADFYQNTYLFPGLIIINMIFSLAISSYILFEADIEDGSFDQLIISSLSPRIIITAKILSYWIIAAWPTILIIPLFGIFYTIPFKVIIGSFIVNIISSFAICIILVFSSLLTCKIKRNIMLNSLISFPFTIAIIIFSTVAINNLALDMVKEAFSQISIIISLILILFPLILITGPIIF